MTPRRIVLAFWIVFAIYAWPGYLTPDGVDALADARNGSFTDWYPVMWAEIWHLVGALVSGPASMLVLQSGLFVTGIFAVATHVVGERRAAWVAGITLVFPPVMASLAVISPQAQIAGFAAAALGALLSPRPWLRRAGIVLAFVACGMGDGAGVATFAILAIAWPFQPRLPRWQRVAAAAATTAALMAANALVASWVVDEPSRRVEIARAGNDLIGTLDHEGALSDAQIRSQLRGVALVPADHLADHVRGAYGHPERYFGGVFVYPDPIPAKQALIDARARVARSHPLAFAAHRWHQAVRVLGLSRPAGWTPAYTAFLPTQDLQERLSLYARHAPLQKLVGALVRRIDDTWLAAPWLYALVALGLLGAATRAREWIAITVLASGIAAELGVIYATPTTTYIESTWLIAATVSAAAIVITARIRPSSRRRETS